VPNPDAGIRLIISVNVAFCKIPKPKPNRPMPAITAAGDASHSRPAIPAVAMARAGASSRAWPTRSPSRPAPQLPAVPASACVNRPATAMFRGSPVASGRNETTTPAVTVLAAKISAGRRSPGWRSPASNPTGRS